MVLVPDRSSCVVNELSSQLHVDPVQRCGDEHFLGGGAHSIGLSADGTKLYVGLLFTGKIAVLNRVARTLVAHGGDAGDGALMATDAVRQRMIVSQRRRLVDVVR
jgi:DNA-binding beta-propeller fold protein YncE